MQILVAALLLPSVSLSKTFVVNFRDAEDLSVLNDCRAPNGAKLVALRKNAKESQRRFRQKLAGEVKLGKSIWLTNSLVIDVDESRSSFDKMQSFPEVLSIEEVTEVFLARVVKGRALSDIEKPLHANGVRHIGAPKIWQDYGFCGEGQLIGVIDTGIDPNHPDLVGRTALFRDYVQNLTEPYDDNGHGSHCAGSIAGGNTSGTAIGVAPKAKLIVAKALSQYGSGYADRILSAMQWMADPDDNPMTDDCPTAVSNSWGGQTHTYYLQAVRRWIQLGIVPVFATGNSGPGARTVLVPAGFKESLAVGAVSVLDDIARFSSRGPVYWDNSPLIKPDIAAPGVDIQSAKPGGGYNTFSGTSMACPHVAALTALMRQARPELTVGALRWLIESTCLDLGSSGKDNTFGYGRVNGYEALKKAMDHKPISGTIVDSLSGEPLEANVYLDGAPLAQQVHLPTATFQFFVTPGSHQIGVEKFGYEDVALDVTAEEDSALSIQLVRQPEAALSLTLEDKESGAAVPCRVKVLDTPLPIAEATNGQCSFTLPLGDYELLVMSVGHATTKANVSVGADGVSVTVSLPAVPPILLVDDDDGAKYESFFIKALPPSVGYDRVEPHRFGQLEYEDLLAYEKVIWFTGDISRSPITQKDEEAIERYLKSGGDIILTGQHLTESLRFSPFLRKALAVRCANVSVDSREVKGLSMNLSIAFGDGANNQNGPDRLNAFNTGREIMQYKPIGGAAAVSAFELGGTSVTLGFGFEAVSSKRDRATLMEKLLGLLPSKQVARLPLIRDKELRRAFMGKLSRDESSNAQTEGTCRDLRRWQLFTER